ncbi:MAG: phosphopantothenoylcysteine decarboxylase, partial [Lentimicrobium sp.]|nr:phosphopantothenoylcysteine decarboxylase [Lentimicrobium sp.]
FAAKGADVSLITGPVSLSLEHQEITRFDVTSADEMYELCMSEKDDADIIVMAAAVADYKPAVQSVSKLKKSEVSIGIQLLPTQDILTGIGKTKKPGQIICGFALETDHEEENARKKLQSKNLDLIVLNSLQDQGAGFKTLTNKISIIFKNGQIQHFPVKPKREVAQDIIAAIISII